MSILVCIYLAVLGISTGYVLAETGEILKGDDNG